MRRIIISTLGYGEGETSSPSRIDRQRRDLMNEYLHHVPGRMRIRTRVLRSESQERSQALRRLRAIPGVSHSVASLLRSPI